VLWGKDVHDIEELKRQGLSIRAIQPVHGLRPEAHWEVPDPAGGGAGVRTAAGATKQTGPVQAIPGRAVESGGVECASAAAGTAHPNLE
jgi:hypothetical protein